MEHDFKICVCVCVRARACTGGAIVGEYALHKVFDQAWENSNKGVRKHRQQYEATYIAV
jgi:hypothetical protein